jgi:AcrR family transcriptional regulator
MARTRKPEASRAAIIAAARRQFGANGFERTTIRSVAAEAAVDPALVIHYFRSKDGLFAEASRLDITLPDLTGVPADRVVDALLPLFVELWGPSGPLLPMLRAASTSRAAADALLGVFEARVAPALMRAARDHARERAALIGAQLLGIAVSRFILGAPSVRDMDEATLAQWLRPVIAHYLTCDAPPAH